jgi:hypothetical protein
MSGHPFAVIARLTMPPSRWRATYQGTAQPQGARTNFSTVRAALAHTDPLV